MIDWYEVELSFTTPEGKKVEDKLRVLSEGPDEAVHAVIETEHQRLVGAKDIHTISKRVRDSSAA